MDIRTIRDLVLAVQKNKIILPAIQRDYVWDKNQIYQLFDSIMQEFPIGEFLIWNVDARVVNDGGLFFYEFFTDYKKESTNTLIRKVDRGENYLVVLDGQQRIQSLVLGLLGSYVEGARSKKKYLYMNLCGRPEDMEENDGNFKYEFCFLNENDALSKNEDHKRFQWFAVSDILNCERMSDLKVILNKFAFDSDEDRTYAKEMLQKLMNFVNGEKNYQNQRVVGYQKIENRPFEDVVEMFIRKNNGGTPLEKTELLFSTVNLTWPDAKNKMKEFLTIINYTSSGGKCFNFDVNFLMRASLYLLDEPMKMNVSKFRKFADRIKDHWNSIEDALKKTTNLLQWMGFSSKNITADNAILPIAYYIYNKGKLDQKNKQELKKYFIVAQLKRVFGASSNSVLEKTREAIKNNRDFKLSDFKNLVLGDKDFKVDKEVAQKWLGYKKGSKWAFMILTLLYPEVKVEAGYEFHEDHLHADSLLSKRGLDDEKDLLANLQFMTGSDNQVKSDRSLKKWIAEHGDFKYHPEGISLDIKYFRKFIEKRGELMVEELIRILN